MPFDAVVTTRISRPKLLVRAARAGMAHYRRERDLAGALKRSAPGGSLIERLTAAEAACDDARRSGAPSYSPTRHVKLLTALLAEARAAALA
jgi:hypothetical protein